MTVIQETKLTASKNQLKKQLNVNGILEHYMQMEKFVKEEFVVMEINVKIHQNSHVQ